VSEVKQIKAHLIHAAYVGAAAVFANEPAVAEDPTFQDAALRKRAVEIYEEAKIQYAAIKAALEDNTVWLDPVLPVPVVPVKPVVQAPVPLPGQDIGANLAGVAGLVGAVANAVGTVVPQANVAGQVAGAVSAALAGK
jgi:hypothetical protein